MRPDPIIAVSEATRDAITLKVIPGTLLWMCTDGLVERREYPIDQGLTELLHALPDKPPAVARAAVVSSRVGAQQTRDGITLPSFQRSGETI